MILLLYIADGIARSNDITLTKRITFATKRKRDENGEDGIYITKLDLYISINDNNLNLIQVSTQNKKTEKQASTRARFRKLVCYFLNIDHIYG